jgi:threonine aldolase
LIFAATTADAPRGDRGADRGNTGTALGYGGDAVTAALQARLAEVFETPVRVYPVPTGTAANAVALAASCTPFGAVYCSADAHINTAECNATSFFGGGTKLTPIAGPNGKVDPAALESAIATAGKGLAHKSQPAAVNLVQATDLGAVYSLDEIAGVAQVARAHGLKVHMDGARFANALARLGCTPAEASWRAGVDVLSLGVTKNGGLLADAIVVFNPDTAASIGFHLRRAGLVWSKMRFAAAQVIAYVENDLWLRLARQANAAATAIAARSASARRHADRAGSQRVVRRRGRPRSPAWKRTALFQRRGRLARFVCRWDTSRPCRRAGDGSRGTWRRHPSRPERTSTGEPMSGASRLDPCRYERTASRTAGCSAFGDLLGLRQHRDPDLRDPQRQRADRVPDGGQSRR